MCATIKQKTIKKIGENRGNISKAMREAGVGWAILKGCWQRLTLAKVSIRDHIRLLTKDNIFKRGNLT